MSSLSATDRCVKCGLCLPHCPTFRLSGIEADSPRGRISLMQAIDSGQAPWSPGLFRYLDRCLECRACEAMCPSKVPFAQLMDQARARIEPHRRRPALQRWLRRSAMAALASPAGLQGLRWLTAMYQRLGLHWLVSRVSCLPKDIRRLNRMLPPRQRLRHTAAHLSDEVVGEVDLFRGCVARILDRNTLESSQRFVEALGYRVYVSGGQTCCGALHQHGGAPTTAERLARRNRRAFGGSTRPILITASGCAAQLCEYDRLYGEVDLARRFVEITQFVREHGPDGLEFEPLPQRVAVHLPCTHRNGLGRGRDILDVLSWIPELVPAPILDRGCCGAAGSYMLSQPQVADTLRDAMLGQVRASDARLLVSTNIGCALHLQAGLNDTSKAIEVLHPIALLERQLKHRSSN
jgi:glycolate oxidase iron-sulfur subunit